MKERQRKVLEFIKIFYENKRYPPSTREIQSAIGIKSTSTVSNDLKVLEELGFIKKTNLKSRGIEIINHNKSLDNNDTIDIPIVGNVAAGVPILAEQNIESTYPVPSNIIKSGEYFILRVQGESMIEAGIFDGDLILVHKTNYADHGDIVVALLDDSATVKRLYKKNNQVMLVPENSSMEPIIPEYVEILGKVVSLFREYI